MLLGYVDRLVARPGEQIRLHASGTGEPIGAEIVRFSGAPGKIYDACTYEPIGATLLDGFRLDAQPLSPGSYGVLPESISPELREAGGFSFWFLPTLDLESPQTLLASLDLAAAGIAVRLMPDRVLAIRVGTVTITVAGQVRSGEWHFIAVCWSRIAHRLSILIARRRDPRASFTTVQRVSDWDAPADWLPAHPWSVAAERSDSGYRNHFNGKVAAVTFFRDASDEASMAELIEHGPREPVARYAFEIDMHSARLIDESESKRHGEVFQHPTRAVSGPRWTGASVDPSHAPERYDAIHFHDDDLTDAAWPRIAEWRVPADLASGIYGISLRTQSGARDVVPFFVAPSTAPRQAQRSLAVLFPTLSYLAYANEQLINIASDLFTAQDANASLDAYRYIAEQRLFSLYDRHRDGSGFCYASLRRPLLNFRHDHRTALLGGSPHQFAADLQLAAWLDGIEQPFDALTDELLDAEGEALLTPYRVVMTGTHPEYWTRAMLEAARRYLESGGRLMYLGANGFYWVTALSGDRDCIEIRRIDGNRAWQAGPGEAHLSFTGEYGGLWRMRGMAPQGLTGVGFTAQGFDCNRPYERSARSDAADVAWVFDGVAERVFGDQPNAVLRHGAAGFEIDRTDPALGTPAETVVLATASGFSDAYQLAVEDVLVSDSRQSGSVNPLVRADLTLLPYPAGGAVFSTGSIAWCGALGHRCGDNAIARITQNVLIRFLSDSPVLDP